MKRKHQRTLELIFARPASGNLPWRDVEALFEELGGEVSEQGFFIGPTPRPIQTKAQSHQSASGLSSTE